MRRSTGDLCAGAVFAAGAGWLLVHTAGAGYAQGPSIAFDAALLPRLFLWLGLACGLAMAGQALIRRLRGAGEAPPPALSPVRLAGAVALTGGFVASFAVLGYWPTMLVFPPAIAWTFGYRRPVATGGATLVFAGLVWVIFHDVLMVRMAPWPGG